MNSHTSISSYSLNGIRALSNELRLYVQGEALEMKIGIDISKVKIDCTWLRDLSTGKVKSKVFKNTLEGHLDFRCWSEKQTGRSLDELHFVMEATGIYHEALTTQLHEWGAQVSVVNPAKISHYAKSLGARSKTDKKDSVIIARYAATHELRLWQPEPEEIRYLKALISRIEALSQDIQREENRLEKAGISQTSEDVMSSIDTVLEILNAEKKRVEALIDKHIDQHPGLKQDKALLESIPGVGPVVSRYMLSVIRSRDFESAPQCAAYLGLIPLNYESGSSVRKPPRLSKAGNARIRAKLYMAAIVSVQHNPDIQNQYKRLLKMGKSKMSALGAAMRKLVQICFGVLKHQTPYQPQMA